MKKNIIFALLSNFVTAFSAWLMLWYLIRFGRTEDVGLFGLVQAIALPLYMFLTFKLRTIQITDTSNNYSNNDYLGARILLAAINIFIAVIFFNIFYSNDIVLAIIALSFGYSLSIIKEYYISLMQLNERNDIYLISNIFQSILSLLVFISVYYLTKNIIYAIAGFSLLRLPSLYIDQYLTKKFNNTNYNLALKNLFNKEGSIKKLLIVGMPLGITAVIGATFTSIPRIVLEKFDSLEALGIFTMLMSLIVVVNLFMSSFTQAILPRLSKLYKADMKAFNKMSFIFFILLFVISLVGLFLGYLYSKEILSIVFGKKYSIYSNEFFMCMISAALLAFFHYANMLLNAIKYFSKQMYIYALCALFSLVSSILLIPLYGLEGAIYSSMICSLTGFLLSMITFYYKTRVEFNETN